MALRSRSRTATSGPGRGPGSDARTRHRRPPARCHSRDRPTRAEELRRRAELLFGERAQERRESGHRPPGTQPRAGTATATGTAPGLGTARRARAAVPPDTAASIDGLDGLDGPDGLDGVEGGDGLDEVDEADEFGGGDEGTVAAGVSGAPVVQGWRERAGTALRERMPVWLQTRCGLERRGVLALAVLLAVAAVFAVQHFWTGRTQSVRAPQMVRAEAPFPEDGKDGKGTKGDADVPDGNAPGTAGAEIVVDVGGKVRAPGVHRLPAGSRVADALRAAGGVRPGTSTEGLNRARFLVDGEQIVVGGPAPAAGPAPGGLTGAGPAGSSAGAGGPAAPISLNAATADQLDTLPGVGPVLAQHIIDYRTRHGGYRSVDELRQVNGIGDRRFADLRNLVRP